MPIKRIIALSGLAMAFAGPVAAADLLVEAPELPEVVETSGWYLRGDIGYVFGSKNKGNYDFYNIPFPGIDDTHRFDHIDFDGAASFGVGVGYRFNEVFRADLTLDYFKADVDTKTRCPFQTRVGLGMADPINGHCDFDGESSAEIWNPMVNAYADLPKIGSITPYIGLGIGAALVNYDSLSVTQNCGDCPPGTPVFTSENEGHSEWRLAGAAMVGAAYNITDNTLLDIGYKYTRIGSGDAWGYDDQDSAAGATGVQSRDNGFDFHAVRVGVRYEFN